MKTLSTSTILALVFAAWFTTSCGDDGGGGDDTEGSGTAPGISALTFNPTTIIAGQQGTVSGSFTFEDPDGDVNGMTIRITLPDGTSQDVQGDDPTPGEEKGGTIMFMFRLSASAAGTYPFELWISDAGGNASNHLTGSIEAQ